MNSYNVNRYKLDIRKGRKINEGFTAEIYEWEDEKKVLKLAKNKDDHRIMLMEYRNSQVAWNNDLPVPQPFELLYVNGRPGIVFERIHGITLKEYFRNQLLYMPYNPNKSHPPTVQDIARMMAKIVSETHKKSIQNMPSQRNMIIKAIKRSKHLTLSESKLVLDSLNSIPIKQQLCHGDLNLSNIIIRNNEAILIDWMYASMGNPEADFASYLLMLGHGQLPMDDSTREILIKALMDEYIKLSDTTSQNIDDWMLPTVIRRLSLGILPRIEKKRLFAQLKERMKKYTE